MYSASPELPPPKPQHSARSIKILHLNLHHKFPAVLEVVGRGLQGHHIHSLHNLCNLKTSHFVNLLSLPLSHLLAVCVSVDKMTRITEHYHMVYSQVLNCVAQFAGIQR